MLPESTAIPRITVPPALDLEGATAFACAVESAAQDPACRVIRIEGTPGEFCRGLDFQSLVSEGNEGAAEAGMRAFLRCLRAIRTAGRPVIAVVDGPALGGGLGIAAACDVGVATAQATFGLPEMLFGLIPAAILPVILERIPAQKARLWAMTSRSRTAQEALAIGLVDTLVAARTAGQPDPLVAAVRKWERELSRASPDAVRTLKRFTSEINTPTLLEAIERGADETGRTLAGGTVAEGIRRFLAGESAPWLAQEEGP